MYFSAIVLLLLVSGGAKADECCGGRTPSNLALPVVHRCCGEVVYGVCTNPCPPRFSPRCRFFHRRSVDVSNDLLAVGNRGGAVDLSKYLQGVPPRTIVVRVDHRPFLPFEYVSWGCHKTKFTADRYNRIKSFLRTLDFTDPNVRSRLSRRLGEALSDRSRVLSLQEKMVEKLTKAETYRDMDVNDVDRLSNNDVIDLFNAVVKAGLNSAFN